MTGPIARVLIAPIRFYQRFISPALPPSCRFTPSCSAYAVGAITEHGALRGMWMAVKRIGKCHPWHRGGYDPVPPRKAKLESDTGPRALADPDDIGRKSGTSHVKDRVDPSDSQESVPGTPDTSATTNSTTNSLGLVASTKSFGRGTT